MACAIQQDLCLAKGASKTLRLTVRDDDGLVDLTGSTVYFTLNDTLDTVTPLVEKDSGTITEIEILSQTGATLGQADIKIVPSDTSSLVVGVYYYDVWVQLSGGEKHLVSGPAKFIVEAALTVIP